MQFDIRRKHGPFNVWFAILLNVTLSSFITVFSQEERLVETLRGRKNEEKTSEVSRFELPDEFGVSRSKASISWEGPRAGLAVFPPVGDALLEFSVKLEFKGSWRRMVESDSNKVGRVQLILDIEPICSASTLKAKARLAGIEIKDLNSDNIHELLKSSKPKVAPIPFDSAMISSKISVPKRFPMDWVKVEFGTLDFPSSGKNKKEGYLYRLSIRQNEKLKRFTQKPAYGVTYQRTKAQKNASLAKSVVQAAADLNLITNEFKKLCLSAIKDWLKNQEPGS